MTSYKTLLPSVLLLCACASDPTVNSGDAGTDSASSSTGDSASSGTEPEAEVSTGSSAESGESSTGTPEAVCGDGVLSPEAGEACDDGNLEDEDGCNAACRPSGEEVWRRTLEEFETGDRLFAPVVSSTEVLVPVAGSFGGSLPTGLIRVDSEGNALGLLEPELFSGPLGQRGMVGLHLTSEEGLRYASLAADTTSYDWVESATDGSGSVRTPLTWTGGFSGAGASTPTGLGLLVVSSRNAETEEHAFGFADPAALEEPIVPAGVVSRIAFPTLVATDDGAFLLGAELLELDAMARPSIWRLTTDGAVQIASEETLREDRWFTSAALSGGSLLLVDNDRDLWRLDQTLTLLPDRAAGVFEAPGAGWWLLPGEGPATRVSDQLAPVYMVDSFVGVQSIQGASHGGDVFVVEFRVLDDGNAPPEVDLARYSP